ncbi:MAG: hypothetical protein EWV83_25045 [Microcystis sp. M_OC_Ca_00000000_S217Cul]|jgi:hypothetical protein|uniref:hypothetical protein n=1 Tax=Microcystis sp. M_OC_Ca_00000000_S217Cul TaxID=2486214 RepID=UPI0011969A44|nr:hypothetical protein [Microcystis sp. M_OC_Ca_00000000_S217Cul]TRT69735.1 MAG: hypothetical protein EWV83_25045 [Microcystis sp. M_OC_Ca_00000000_S217Cul]
MLQLKSPCFGLIRIGAEGDGGYRVPNDMAHVADCHSVGLSQAFSVEIVLAEQRIDIILSESDVDAPSVNVDV